MTVKPKDLNLLGKAQYFYRYITNFLMTIWHSSVPLKQHIAQLN